MTLPPPLPPAAVPSDPSPRNTLSRGDGYNGTARPARRARVAWLVVGGILAIASLGWGTYNVLSLLAHEEYTLTETFAAADVAALDVRSENGSITVEAGQADVVSVTAEVSDGWKPSDVTMRVVGGVLELRAGCPALASPWCVVDFTVTVPDDMPVRADGSNGSVRVRGMNALVDVDTDNGSIDLETIGGDIRVSNDNGGVVGRRLTSQIVDATNDNGRIELSFVEPPRRVTGRTSNGRIEVVVPDHEVAYRVDVSTRNGSTDVSVRTDPASEHLIDLTTSNGSLTVRPPG